MMPIRVLLLYAQSSQNETHSFQFGWPRHFRSHPRFRTIPLNIMDHRVAARLRRRLLTRWGRFDAIVMLHSVFSNSCNLKGWLYEAVRTAPQPKAYFIGNEYKLMPEKMAFCEDLEVSLLISQILSPDVHTLYRQRLGCDVSGIPNGALDTALFVPKIPYSDRPIDIGYRAIGGPRYLGHTERRKIAEVFLQHGPHYGLSLDISLDPDRRLAEHAWAEFLNRCQGQLGVEAHGDFFELTDDTRNKVNQYEQAHPNATDDEIYKLFFENYPNPISGRTLASRHVEAAGTKTVQILVEGRYNGYLEPDTHYIPLRKDFSNISEAVAKFRDQGYCQRITENAYNLAAQELTYEKLIDRFHTALKAVL